MVLARPSSHVVSPSTVAVKTASIPIRQVATELKNAADTAEVHQMLAPEREQQSGHEDQTEPSPAGRRWVTGSVGAERALRCRPVRANVASPERRSMALDCNVPSRERNQRAPNARPISPDGTPRQHPEDTSGAVPSGSR